MSVALEMLVLLALVLLNGVLAGAEIAIVSMRKTRVQELVDRGSASALAVLRLRQEPESFLATVQIGITVISATAGAFGGASFAADLTPLLERVDFLAPQAHFIALTGVVLLISYLSLVLGELVPKSLALKSSERYALFIGRPLLALRWLARPLVRLLTASSNLVLKSFGDSTNFIEGRLSSDELRALVKEATDAGTVHPQAGEIAARALDISRLRASDLLIPRQQVVAVPHDASEQELRRAISAQVHTRVVVYEGEIDHVLGWVSIKDILERVWAGRPVKLPELLRPPLFVPTFKPAVELLDELRDGQQPFAMVIDEHGGFSGIVALEDLLEELMGEVFVDERHDGLALLHREPDGSVVLDATATVRDVNRALGSRLPEGTDWHTVAGLVLERLASMPVSGDAVTLEDGTRLEVLEASPSHVRLVRLSFADDLHHQRS
jgi:putative hemolysin